jgi:hypothetical protein
VNNLTANCFPSTPHHETSTSQSNELTTTQDTSDCIEESKCKCINTGKRINLLVAIGLSAIVILQTAGLVFLKRENSLLNSKVKSNYMCLQNIPPAVPSATTPDIQDFEAEEFNDMYEQTQEAGVDYCNTDSEQQYCEI